MCAQFVSIPQIGEICIRCILSKLFRGSKMFQSPRSGKFVSDEVSLQELASYLNSGFNPLDRGNLYQMKLRNSNLTFMLLTVSIPQIGEICIRCQPTMLAHTTVVTAVSIPQIGEICIRSERAKNYYNGYGSVSIPQIGEICIRSDSKRGSLKEIMEYGFNPLDRGNLYQM